MFTYETGTFIVDGNGTIGVTDLLINRSNQDYNDIVYQVQSLEGSQAIGVSAIEDVVADRRNWLDTEVGEDILGDFDNADLSQRMGKQQKGFKVLIFTTSII